MKSLEFIQQVASGNASDAKDTLNNLLSTMAFDALSSRKQEIAKTIFNSPSVQEEETQIQEAVKKPDIDVRVHYSKHYADNVKKNGMKNATDRAYKEVEKKFGPETVKSLKAWHNHNRESFNEGVEINEASLTSGMKKVHDISGGVHSAKIYHNREDSEYQVHFYKNGKHMGEGPIHYTDDLDDAKGTANSELKRMNK